VSEPAPPAERLGSNAVAVPGAVLVELRWLGFNGGSISRAFCPRARRPSGRRFEQLPELVRVFGNGSLEEVDLRGEVVVSSGFETPAALAIWAMVMSS